MASVAIEGIFPSTGLEQVVQFGKDRSSSAVVAKTERPGAIGRSGGDFPDSDQFGEPTVTGSRSIARSEPVG